MKRFRHVDMLFIMLNKGLRVAFRWAAAMSVSECGGKSLWAVSGSIPDLRGARGRRYPLRPVSVPTLAAMLTGATTCARCCVGVVVCRMRRCLFRGFRGPRATRHIAIFSRPWMWLRRSARWVCGLSAAALRLVLRWAASVCAGARPGVMTGARAFAWRLPLPAIRGLRLGSCGSGRRTARRRRRCRCSRACRSRARRSRGMPRFAGAPYARPSATAAAPVRLPSRPTDRARWPTSPNRFAAIRETFAENRLEAIETAKYGVLRIALRRCAGTVEMLSIFRQTRGGARCSDSDRKR